MDDFTKKIIKENLKKSIRNFFKKRKKQNYQVLDDIFPKERRVRSLIGGLETSLGVTFWEPLSKTLAEINGFEIIKDKILIPNPFPITLQRELDRLVSEREKKPNNIRISTEECIERLRDAALQINPQDINEYISPSTGTGVDIHLFKDGIEYMFDIKTTQSNQGDFKKFNKQMLEWYAYRLVKNSDAKLEARIAIPFNPYKKSWYEEKQSMLLASPLDIERDISVENQFWDFCSGQNNTFEDLQSLFIELGKENFAAEFHDIFYPG